MKNTFVYIYDRDLNKFFDQPITLHSLDLMSRDPENQAEFKKIRKNIYNVKICDNSYRCVVVTSRKGKPVRLRRYPSDFPKGVGGYASVNESKQHKALKEALRRCAKVKIKLLDREYVIHREYSGTEEVFSFAGSRYEVDCYWILKNIDADLERMLGCPKIFFEIHHFCPVTPEKISAFRLNGMPVLEFDLDLTVLPEKYLIEDCPIEDIIAFWVAFLENVDKNCVKGTYICPYELSLEWTKTKNGGLKASVEIEEGMLEVIIFLHEDGSYRVLYKIGEKIAYTNRFRRNKMKSLETAKVAAEYSIFNHITSTIKLKFR